MSKPSKLITDCTANEAKELLLQSGSYCTLDLPNYFDFAPVLKEADDFFGNASSDQLRGIYASHKGKYSPSNYDKVNHVIVANKNGSYDWRPFQLIHPFLYVELVRVLTDFDNWTLLCKQLGRTLPENHIECLSTPLVPCNMTLKETTIVNWWEKIEQKSIQLSSRFTIIATTDIANCYGELYTHSIAWAIHGKEFAKEHKFDKHLLGNQLDSLIQEMHYGQTNGIPQGNLASDLIAEVVLHYGDELIAKSIAANNIEDYQILRYRDDYRIFTNSYRDAQTILRVISDVLISLNFHININKTTISDDVITSSIKKDKLYSMTHDMPTQGPAKTLIAIRDIGLRYPNSGTLVKMLGDFRKSMDRTSWIKGRETLYATTVDIMRRNPRTYPTAASLLSLLLPVDNNEANKRIDELVKRFGTIPNTGLLDVWLQRVSLTTRQSAIDFKEPLCKVVEECVDGDYDPSKIWNLEWINNEKAKKILRDNPIVNLEILLKNQRKITLEETESFIGY